MSRIRLSPHRTALAPLLLSIGLASGCSGGGIGRSDPGTLEIEIVSPSRDDTFVSTNANVPFGGTDGGWSAIDPAPTIHWWNDATGASGETGQLRGTWSVYGGVNLLPGANHIVVRARNGVQHDAYDSITVTYRP